MSTENMKYKVYIDGQEGTTGLKIVERFDKRNDVELLRIDDDLRKNTAARANLINQSDFTFLCLPDEAAREAVTLVTNQNVRIIDASTAHRTNPNWAYGLPELSFEHRTKIANSKRVAVPGCYATGFITAVFPLIKAGVMSPSHPLTCHALSGYSGGGKKMIAQYEQQEITDNQLLSPRQYALTQQHKHLKEMQAILGLDYPPMFNPIVCNYYSGMVVSVPILTRTLAKSIDINEIYDIMKNHYKNERFVKVMPLQGGDILNDGFLASNTLSGTNMLELFVCGNDQHVLLAARLDNLGKGASGAAVQCFNIMTNNDEGVLLV